MNIIDFQEDLTGIATKVSEKVLWPCTELTISITSDEQPEGNIFDYIVLELMKEDITEIDTIALKTGLEVDLIKFIQQRLNHKGLLNADNLPTELSKERNKEKNKETHYYHIYRENVSGDLLPQMIPLNSKKNIIADKIIFPDEDNKEQFVQYLPQTSVGKQENDLKEIKVFSPSRDITPPLTKIEDVSLIVNKSNRYKDNTSVNIEVPSGDGVQCYLAVTIVLDRNNDKNWLITNGFTGEFSPQLERAISEISEDDKKWINNLRNCKSKNIVRDPSFKGYSKLEIPKDWQAYPNTGVALLKAYEKYNDTPKSTKEKQELREKGNDIVRNLHNALEWGLFYHLKNSQRCITDTLKYVETNSIEPLVENIAKKIGIEIPLGFICSNTALMKRTLKEPSNLSALVTLTLLICKENLNHPFYTIGQEDPNFLLKLQNWNSLRNSVVHQGDELLDKEELEEWRLFIRNFIDHILPEMNISKTATVKGEEDNRRNGSSASAIVERVLGLATTRVISEKIFQKMVKAEDCLPNHGECNPLVVLILYQILEWAFKELLKGSIGSNESNNYDLMIFKAKKARLNPEPVKMEALFKSSNSMVKAAKEGRSASMQGCCMAWLYKSSEESLIELGRKNNEILLTVSEIARLRGHGGIPEKGSYSDSQLRDLKKNTFKFISSLFELNYIND